jgi:hypothetical protein
MQEYLTLSLRAPPAAVSGGADGKVGGDEPKPFPWSEAVMPSGWCGARAVRLAPGRPGLPGQPPDPTRAPSG